MSRTVIRGGVYLFAALIASGCEARLSLSEIENERQKNITRFDDFQAIAVSPKDQRKVLVGKGVILVDRGNGWARVAPDIGSTTENSSFIDVSVCPDSRFVALDFNKRVWLSDQTLTQWRPRSIGSEENILALTCDTNNAIWVAGSFSSLLRSEDQGVTWHPVPVPADNGDQDFMFTDIQFVDSNYGFLVGEFGKLFTTQDGGRNWQVSNTLPDTFYPQASLFVDSKHGWVGGLEGIIYHTEDGGYSWQREAADVDVPLYGFAGPSVDLVYAVGGNGVLLERRDGKWRQHDKSGTGLSYLRAIGFAHRRQLIIAGGNGALQNIDIPIAQSLAAE